MMIPQEVCSFASGEDRFADLGTNAVEKTYKWSIPKSAEALVGPLEGGSLLPLTLDLKRKRRAL